MHLFRRPKPDTPELADALSRLAQLAEAVPALRDAATLQGTLLRACYADPAEVGVFGLTAEHAAAKLAGGTPLLHGEAAPIDLAAVARQLPRLAGAIASYAEPGAAASIAAAVRAGTLDGAALARAALGGDANTVRQRADELHLSGDLLSTLLRFSLFPALTRLAAQLAPTIEAAAWGQGFCPLCGSAPLLGEHRGLEQRRYLRCGLCASAWPVDRLWCPHCGTREHEHLGYLHVEGDEQRRASTCEQCLSYLKVLATLGPLAPLDLLVADIETLPLDLVALERGYITL